VGRDDERNEKKDVFCFPSRPTTDVDPTSPILSSPISVEVVGYQIFNWYMPARLPLIGIPSAVPLESHDKLAHHKCPNHAEVSLGELIRAGERTKKISLSPFAV
jgi:hypothetical protein